ncbi:hypothetical protein AB0P12_25205 [Streptomyces subrutilus]|uniref:hypothetical protein n=1 Tax=Streptomyces subrutilus TaxID=36818 RepID=UPI00344867E5
MSEQTTTGAVTEPHGASPQDAPPAQPPAPRQPPGPAPAPDGEAAPKFRRRLFAVLRWTAAALVFASAAAGTAYGLVRPERTELPGLSTLDDGRWAYPVLAKPELPAGAPLPKGADNPDATHYAALSALLLTPPAGAGPDSGFAAGEDGAVSPETFLGEYPPDARAALQEGFAYEGLRQIAGRAWTMPDGTRTRVYLLRFHSFGFGRLFPGCAADAKLDGAAVLVPDPDWAEAKRSQRNDLADYLETRAVSVYEEKKPYGDTQTRLGCLDAGDVQAVILQTRKGGAAPVPFHQTVILQSQLLS